MGRRSCCGSQTSERGRRVHSQHSQVTIRQDSAQGASGTGKGGVLLSGAEQIVGRTWRSSAERLLMILTLHAQLHSRKQILIHRAWDVTTQLHRTIDVSTHPTQHRYFSDLLIILVRSLPSGTRKRRRILPPAVPLDPETGDKVEVEGNDQPTSALAIDRCQLRGRATDSPQLLVHLEHAPHLLANLVKSLLLRPNLRSPMTIHRSCGRQTCPRYTTRPQANMVMS